MNQGPRRWIGAALIGGGVSSAAVLVASTISPLGAVGALLIVCALAGLCGVLLGGKQPVTPPAYPDQDRLDKRAAELAEDLPARAGSPAILNVKEVIQESRGATAQRGREPFGWDEATRKISPPPAPPSSRRRSGRSYAAPAASPVSARANRAG